MVLSIILFALLIVSAVLFVWVPIAGRSGQRARMDAQRHRVESEKGATLQLIRDLEFDHRTGKLSDADYESSLDDAIERAIDLLIVLDEMGVESSWTHDRLEKEIAKQRGWLENNLSAWILALGFLGGAGPVADVCSAQDQTREHPSGPGSIYGQLYTADHPDSFAAGAGVTLIFRDAEKILHRIPATSSGTGGYRYDNLPVDPEIGYVIRVEFFDRQFLSAPVEFEAGEPELEFNFLVSRDAAPMPAPDQLPPDHVTGGVPRQGRPATPNPLTMVVITVTVLAGFALPVYTLRRKDRQLDGEPQSAMTQGLIRDIAALDLRRERDEIDETGYRSVRESLFKKLAEQVGALSAGSEGSAPSER